MSENNNWQESKNSGSNIFAILGIVFAFLVAPIGLILSIIGKNKALQDNDASSANLAKVGMILSIVFMVLEVLVFVAVLAVGCTATKEITDLANKMNQMMIGL